MTTLMPSSVADARWVAIDELAASRLAALPLSTLLLYLIVAAPAAGLPQLGWQTGVIGESWRLAADDTARRTLISRTLTRRRHRGTDFAVRDALDSVGITSALRHPQETPVRYDSTFRHNHVTRHAQAPAWLFWVIVVGEPTPTSVPIILAAISQWQRLSVRGELFWVADEADLLTPAEYNSTNVIG